MATIDASNIKEYMLVVGSDGQHVGTVDQVEGNRIKFTRADDPDGSGQFQHYLPLDCVASCDGGRVKLSIPAHQAKRQAMRESDQGRAPGMGG